MTSEAANGSPAKKRKVDEGEGETEVEATPTPKRGRGRPRKHPIPTSPTPKRPRGRPRKERVEPVLDVPKRPRGRPPKNPPTAQPATDASTAQPAPDVPKRGRGRPRKIPAPDAVPAPDVPKRGRGRPRKDASTTTTPAAPKAPTAPKAAAPPKASTEPTMHVEIPKLPTLEAVTGPAAETSSKTPTKTPAKTPATAKTGKTPRAVPKLADSLAAAATPKAKGKGLATLPSFDADVFGPASPAASISREEFRSNEALRRQREARNFTFEGDADAPRTTRSGRVVGETDVYGASRAETEETEGEAVVDEYGGGGATETDDGTEVEAEMVEEDVEMDELEEEPVVGDILALPSKAVPRVLNILETLTGREREPAPFADEESNEALQGVLSLLRGTVERGEGNSALVTGPRGAGKTRTVERALRLLPPGPIVVRLNGHAQTDDRRAIREMGRQISAAEGKAIDDDDDEEEQPGDFAPTTLPSHLLALLTAPSPRAIIVIIDEFDLFTEHARQALLYCLLDVVQSVQTGPVETTGRGIAVIGVTSRVDTLLLLEKRVKSRFSHRVWRVSSPLAPESVGWKVVLRRALVPWTDDEVAKEKDTEARVWMEDWSFAVDTLLDHKKLSASLARLAGLTTDVRLLFRPFIPVITSVLARELDFLSVSSVLASIAAQLELSGWGTGVSGVSKLRGLPHPALGVLIVAKHLSYAGRTNFSFAQVEDEYLRFARTRLVGSGRTRWPIDILRKGFDYCRTLGLLAPAGPASAGPRFAKVRPTLSPHEVVAFFRGEGGNILGPELGSWGKLSGGHV